VNLRDRQLTRLGSEPFDVAIVGGGINGAVTAAALSARGARVALLDRGDFAGATSQASSNLAWGGIKYLEELELGLVARLCRGRNALVRAFPSSVEEVPFLLLHERGFRRRREAIWAGTWLYWLLGRGATARPRLLSAADVAAEEPAVDTAHLDGAVEYADAWFHDNDSRFTWGLVRSALRAGAAAANYVEVTAAARGEGGWTLAARDAVSGRPLELRARVLVNACGPWADAFNALAGVRTRHRHLLSKGIHLVVPRLTSNRRVLAFPASDGRLFFVVPMGHRSCVGTTDTRVHAPEVEVTAEDRRFVLSEINRHLRLKQPLAEADVVAERCGVRPLAVEAGARTNGADWTSLSRRHVLEAAPAQGQLTIFGGKLTDCLSVGDEACDEVARLGVALPRPEAPWYGEPAEAEHAAFLEEARAMGLEALRANGVEPLATRLWRRYGPEARALLAAIRDDRRLGERVVEPTEYLRAELELAAREEMVVRLDDFLRRRSKIAQVVPRAELLAAPGLREACRILFGDAADARWAEWAGEPGGAPGR
jgi:glycerol-3-phosphate dehydrogenase